MGYAMANAPTVSADAQRAIDYLGMEDPIGWLRDFDVDVDAMNTFIDQLRAEVASFEDSGAQLRAASIEDWSGAASAQYDSCRMEWYDYLILVGDWILFLIDCLVTIVDWVVEIIRWVLTLIDWLLGLLSVMGGILWLLDHFNVEVPGWVRKLLKFAKLVEKAPKLVLTIIGVAAWLVAQLGWVVDWLLDRLRDGIAWVRQWIDICTEAPDAWPDEPIEPAF